MSMSLAEYHALDAIGNGRLSDFIESPALYFGRYCVPKDDQRYIPDTNNGATLLGSMCHALVLEGAEEMERRYRPWRGGMTAARLKKDGTYAKGGEPRHTMSKSIEEYSTFKSDCEADGVTPCDLDDLDTCETIANALYESDVGKLYFHELEGANEQTLLWTELGMAAKARPDRIINPPHRILIDLKFTGAMTLEEAQRIAIAKGYHRQAAWYRRGYFANTGEACRHFVFIAVRTEKPFLVFSWEFDAEAETVAEAQIDLALADILGRKQTGDWLPDDCRGVQPMGIKPWQYSEAVAAELKRRDIARAQGAA